MLLWTIICVNCSKVSCHFLLTIGTYNFVSVIWNSNPVGAAIAGGSLFCSTAHTVILAKAKFFDQVKIDCISQLINDIFKVLQKLLNLFSGTTTLMSSNASLSSGVFNVMFVLYLKDSELEEKWLLGSSL